MTNIVDWGAFRPENLAGANDPYTLTPLMPGETIAYCESCKLGFHADTVAFLGQVNNGRCSSCNVANRWRTFTLPGAIAKATVPAPPVAATEPSSSLVRLDKIREHIGQFVTFEGYVHQVYHARWSGTWFVKFEQTPVPTQGFRLVIWNRYSQNWADAGLSIRDYEHRTIRVRGLIRDDPEWGIQMLIDGPGAITIVDDEKRESPPAPPPATPAAPAEPEPEQRIIWKAPLS